MKSIAEGVSVVNGRSVNTYLLYIVALITVLLLTPFIFILSDQLIKSGFFLSGKSGGDGEAPAEASKIYSTEYKEVDLSSFDGKYTVITQKALNNSAALILSYETVDYMIPYDTLRIAVADGYGNINVSSVSITGKFLENVKSGNYSYCAFNDNTFFISDSQFGYLIDAETLKIVKRFIYPSDMGIYEAAISNDKNAVALTSENGLFLADTDMKNIKELVASSRDINGAATEPRYPVWSGTDDFIYYTLYTDGTPRFPGRTALAPGGNETFSSLAGYNTAAINGERLFYYQSSSSGGNFSSAFKCGFFDAATRAMSDMISSSVYYFNSKVSSNGSLLAALSYNGLLQKLNIIDPATKQLIYSENFGKVIGFDFSPDERGILVCTENDGKRIIKSVLINWHTVEY